jgi:CTP:molybdopterin cytidylyltransferase MocA
MPFTALVMAGSRATGDPVAVATGVAHKALAPVGGVAMFARVVRTLRASSWVERIVVCGLDATVARDLADETGGAAPAVELVRGDRTPGSSAALAITELGLTPPILITTADHPLLSSQTLDGFCERASTLNADAAFGLVPVGLVRAAFPGFRRTAFRFRDGGFCGCNLYALLSPGGCGSGPRSRPTGSSPGACSARSATGPSRASCSAAWHSPT